MPVAYERQRTLLTRSSNTRTLSHPRSSSNAVMITFTFISSFILEKNFSELFFGRSSTAHGMRDEENEVFGSRKIGGKFNVAKFRFFVLVVIRFMSSLTAAVYRMETRCRVGNIHNGWRACRKSFTSVIRKRIWLFSLKVGCKIEIANF